MSIDAYNNFKACLDDVPDMDDPHVKMTVPLITSLMGNTPLLMTVLAEDKLAFTIEITDGDPIISDTPDIGGQLMAIYDAAMNPRIAVIANIDGDERVNGSFWMVQNDPYFDLSTFNLFRYWISRTGFSKTDQYAVAYGRKWRRWEAE